MAFLDEYDAATDPKARVAVVYRWLRSDWRSMYQELRAKRPVLETPAFTMVVRWQDVIEVLSRNELFSVKGYRSSMDPAIGPFMLARDATAINWEEKSAMRAVLPWSDLPSVRDLVTDVVRRSLSELSPKAEIELVKAVGRLVPLRIVQRYFGFPGPDDGTMLRWSKATQWDIFHNPTNDPAVRAASVKAGSQMRSYVWTLLSEAQARMDDPKAPIGRFVRLFKSGETGMALDRAVSNVCGLLVGAIETMSQAIIQATEQILLKPDVFSQARAVATGNDHATLDAIVWEALRFNPITTLVFRHCERDATIGADRPYALVVKKDSTVAACIGSAMFDEVAFIKPDEFRLDRVAADYLHFGFAAHECLGKHVSMAAIPEAVRQIMLLPGLHLLPGDQSKIDFGGGPFPESFTVGIEP